MVNDEQARAKAERGRRFREWCEGPDGLYAVFDAVERNYLASLVGTDIEDQPTRERIYHRVSALRDLKRVMQVAIADGKGAEAIIERLTRMQHKRASRKQKVMA